MKLHHRYIGWRSLLQWLGGIGVIVMAIAIFPMLSVGGMQLFKAENFENPEKVVLEQHHLQEEYLLFIQF